MKKIILIALGVFVLLFIVIFPLTQKEKEKESLDYSNIDNWIEADHTGLKSVDVFFIYPTWDYETEGEYGDVDEVTDRVGITRIGQTSVFEETCNIYMPLYRQVPMKTIDSMEKDNQAFLDYSYNAMAYVDITAALDYYFDNYNDNKPFILAGHSQGSAMVLNVLYHYMQEEEHEDLLKRMVAAYVIGLAPSKEAVDSYESLKFATGESDFNVIVSWTTEGPDASGKSVLLPDDPLVINPLNWKTDDTYASVSENKGSVKFNFENFKIEDTLGLYDAQINTTRHTLICNTYTTWTENPSSFSTCSLHEKDYSLYYYNFQENIKVRSESFLASDEWKELTEEFAKEKEEQERKEKEEEEKKNHKKVWCW